MQEKVSGKRVIKAGEYLIRNDALDDDDAFEDAFLVLSYWRYNHEVPLERAIELLQSVALKKDKNAIFAKRLKRFISIITKLRRFPRMKLRTMQDIGGCRAIVSSPKRVTQIVRELKKRPEFKDDKGKVRFKDYIKEPKEDGYRGYHLMGKFKNDTGSAMSIELQIRTRLQHDWATTLEIVDLFTGQALKSNQGDEEWREFFSSVSEQFAIMEDVHLFDSLPDSKKASSYLSKLLEENEDRQTRRNSCALVQRYSSELDVVRLLQAYMHSLQLVDGRLEEATIDDGYVLLEVDTVNNKLTSTLFKKEQNDQAEKLYSEAEKRVAGTDGVVIALVSTTKVGGIKEAYPNYFADSTDFIAHLIMILDAPSLTPLASSDKIERKWVKRPNSETSTPS